MSRVYNFSAGPSMLPEEVLKKAASEMLDYEGSGQSVMEMSHRSKVYDNIIKTAERLLRELMNIPDNYKVLFLQGGASTQFAAIPLNFMNGSNKPIMLSPVSGLKRHLPRLKNTVMQKPLLLLLTKRSHIYQSLINRCSEAMRIMYIFV